MRFHWKNENRMRKKEKEEVLLLRAITKSMVAAGLVFLFRYVGNIRVFDTFGDWRDEEKRRKRKRILLC